MPRSSPPPSWLSSIQRWLSGWTAGGQRQTARRRRAPERRCRERAASARDAPSAFSAAASSAACWRWPRRSSASNCHIYCADAESPAFDVAARADHRAPMTTRRRLAASPAPSTSSPTSSRTCPWRRRAFLESRVGRLRPGAPCAGTSPRTASPRRASSPASASLWRPFTPGLEARPTSAQALARTRPAGDPQDPPPRL